MPIYEIEGKRVETDKPLTEAEIDEIALSITNKQSPGVLNLLKQGLASDVGLISGVGSTLGALPRTSPDSEERSFMQEFGEAYERGYGAALQAVGGVPTEQSPDLATRAYESGVRAIGAPSSYIGGIGLAKTPIRAIGAGVIGAGAEVGGEIGASFEKAATGEDTGIGRMTGALLSPVPSIAAFSLIKPNVVGIWDKYKKFKVGAKDSGQAYAQGAAKRLLERAARESGVDSIDEIVNDFNIIGSKISNKNYPLLVAMSDNPALRQQATRLAKTDPDFRKRAQDELSRIAVDIDTNANKIFGERFAPIGDADITSIKNVDKRIVAIDNKIEELANTFTPSQTKEQTGQAIANLVEAKKTAIKGELQPLYSQVISEARQEGIEMPSAGVASVYNFVRENNIRDIFGKGTSLDNQLMRVWSPKNGEFTPAKFDDVDSLKRRINELQRGKLTETEARKLSQLEDVLDEARETIPGDFNQRLRDLDLQYYQRLGIPFGTAGIKDIDAKKYAEQVAPIITNNGSALRQFLKATDNDGVEIARNAILSDVYFKTVKDGKVNIGQLNKYVKDKSDVLSQIPGLKEELLMSAVDQRSLLLRKEQLNNAYRVQEKKLADNFLTQYGKEPDFTSVASSILNNRRQLDKMLIDLKQTSPETSKAVVNNVRREILQKALDNPEGAITFLTAPRNKYTINKLFGSDYQDKLKDLAKIQDALVKADLSKVGDVVSSQELDALAKIVPGLDIPYVSSNFRDRIASIPQKIIRLASRVQTATFKNATDDEIAKLLLDPDGLAKLRNTAKGMDLDNLSLANKRKLLEAFADVSPSYFYIAGKSGINEEEQQIQEIPVGSFY